MQKQTETTTTLQELAENVAIFCVEKLAMKKRDRPWEDYAEDIEPIIFKALLFVETKCRGMK